MGSDDSLTTLTGLEPLTLTLTFFGSPVILCLDKSLPESFWARSISLFQSAALMSSPSFTGDELVAVLTAFQVDIGFHFFSGTWVAVLTAFQVDIGFHFFPGT